MKSNESIKSRDMASWLAWFVAIAMESVVGLCNKDWLSYPREDAVVPEPADIS